MWNVEKKKKKSFKELSKAEAMGFDDKLDKWKESNRTHSSFGGSGTGSGETTGLPTDSRMF